MACALTPAPSRRFPPPCLPVQGGRAPDKLALRAGSLRRELLVCSSRGAGRAGASQEKGRPTGHSSLPWPPGAEMLQGSWLGHGLWVSLWPGEPLRTSGPAGGAALRPCGPAAGPEPAAFNAQARQRSSSVCRAPNTRYVHCMCTACAMHVHCMGTAWALHGHCMGTAWARYGHCTGTAHAHRRVVHQAWVEKEEESDPEMRPYFFQQAPQLVQVQMHERVIAWNAQRCTPAHLATFATLATQAPDYLALKASFLEHIAAGRPGTPAGQLPTAAALCMHCACPVHALCMPCACTVHALCMQGTPGSSCCAQLHTAQHSSHFPSANTCTANLHSVNHLCHGPGNPAGHLQTACIRACNYTHPACNPMCVGRRRRP